MKRLVLLVLFLAGGALALPIGCAPGTMQDYSALPEGCTVGPFTYKGFSFFNDGANTAGTNLLSTQINVTPPVPPDYGMDFASLGFNIGPDKYAIYYISYVIDPPPDIIDGFDTTMDASSPTGGGKADIFTTLCIGGYFPSCPEGNVQNLHVFYYSDPLNIYLSDSLIIDPPTNIVHVNHKIVLDTRNDFDATSQITGFRDTATAVPEPSTAFLTLGGFALVALAALRKRR